MSSLPDYRPILGYLIHLISFCFCAKAFSNLPGSTQSTKQFEKIISIGFLASLLMLIYNTGFHFLINTSYNVSLGRFFFVGFLMVTYCLLGVILITLVISALVFVSYIRLALLDSVKASCKFLQETPCSLILSFLPLGILLFSSYNIQKKMYYHLNFNVTGPFLYMMLFLVNFHWAKHALVKVNPLQVGILKERAVELTEQKCLSSPFYRIALFFLIIAPFLTLLFFLSGLAYGVNQQIYLLMMLCWISWLALSIYYLLLRKTQSSLTLLMIFIPLILTLVSYLSLQFKGF